MPHSQRRQTLVIGHWPLVIILCILASLHPLHPSVPSDEADLRALVERFFAAYAQKDLDGFMALWSEKSPEFAARKQTMPQRFAAWDYAFANFAFSRVKVEAGEVIRGDAASLTASLRVAVESTTVNVQTKRRQKQQLVRNFAFVKEGDVWKVWREASAFEDLTDALVAAKTEEERAALLAGEKELVTGELRRVLLNQGNRLFNQSNYPQALTVYRLAQDIAEQIGDQAGIAFTLYNKGEVHRLLSNYPQALEAYQKAQMTFEALGNQERFAATLNSMGLIHFSQGNYAQAMEFYQKSLTLKEALEDKAGAARTLLNIGNVHLSQGNYGQAMEFYQKSLTLKEALRDKAGTAQTLNNIGNVCASQGNYAQALEVYQRSLKMGEDIGDRAGTAITLNNIGNVHASQGSHAQALEFLQKSLTLKEALGDKEGIAITLNNIGGVHKKQAHYGQALEFYQKGLTLAEAIGVSEITSLCYRGIGDVYRAQGNMEKALVAYRNAITTIESMRGQVAGGEQERQRFFEDRVAVYHAMVEVLIEQYRRVGDTSLLEALAYAERAKARVLVDVLQSGKVNVTKAMTTDEQEKERKLNNELVSLNTQIYREKDDTRRDDLKARLQKTRLDYEAFQTSLYALHPELKVQRGETKPVTLDEMRALLPDPKTALLEFVVTEDKTYLFVVSMQLPVTSDQPRRSPEPRTPNPKPVLKVYALDIKRDDLAKRVSEFREEVSDPNRPVDSARPLYDLLLKPAQAQAQGKTTLVIVPDGVLWDLPFQALQPQEGRYLLEDCTLFYAPSLTVLREMMKQWSHGVLEQRSHGNKKANTPTLQHSNTPTLLAFGNPTLGQRAVERTEFVKRDANLKPLLEAEKEVKALAQLYGAGRSKVYVGADAHEERVKAEAGKYRVLHFATHGILNDVSPMYSHLLLAQSASQRVNGSTSDALRPHQRDGSSLTHLPIAPLTQGEDGLLEAWELMKMDLKADAVVLSACETARGRVGAGEGIIGLTWALFVAGCSTTVVSQWKVADDSTRQLMVELHRQLKFQIPISETTKSEIGVAGALRQAALKLRQSRQYRHPFYWAGFVVVGSGR